MIDLVAGVNLYTDKGSQLANVRVSLVKTV